ncbi:MAG: hypothetical protein ACTSRG_12895 [Candidatus Helarchaeota archaeon]
MSLTIILPYDDENNYQRFIPEDFDWSETSKVKLALIDNPELYFNQLFTNDDGFTYDPDKLEFADGSVKQKNQRPINATFGATYTNNINGSWGNGLLIGAAIGGASVLNNRLDLAHSDNRSITYSGVNNSNITTVGTIRAKVTPNYSGTPAIDQSFYFSYDSATNLDLIQITNLSLDGRIAIAIRKSNGVFIVNANLGNWNPTAGTAYIFELNIDLISGEVRLFIDGVQKGVTTGIVESINLADTIKIGNDTTDSMISNFYLEDLVIFNTVQHTSNHSADYSLPEIEYIEASVGLPEFSYLGVGNVQSFDNLNDASIGNVKYISNGQYFDGADWLASDGSYAQANTLAEINTNLDTLDEDNDLDIIAVFTNANTLSSIDELTMEYTGQKYSQNNSWVMNASPVLTDELVDILLTYTKTGNDDIKLILNISGVDYWWAGLAWEISNSSFAQSNDVITILANKTTLPLTGGKNLSFKAIFYSETGQSTPVLDELIASYGFVFNCHDILNCIVYGCVKSVDEMPVDAKIRAYSPTPFIHNNNWITIDVETTADSTGKWQLPIIETESIKSTLTKGIYFDIKYIGDNGNDKTDTIENKIIPNQAKSRFEDLEDLEI